MGTWSDADLDRFGGVRELEIATGRTDGTYRSPLPIWVVRVGDDLVIRSWHGRAGSWFRQLLQNPSLRIKAGSAVRDVSVEEADPSLASAIDEALRAKYGRGWHVDAMVARDAAEAAFRLVP